MTWLTWRQFRASAAVSALFLAIIAFLLAMTPQASELARCVGHSGCPDISGRFLGLQHDHLLQYLSTALVAAPAILGAFWGAPLIARELESGTYRLAWTQSVTRTRWFVTKVALSGFAVAAVCGVFSLMLGAWSSASVNSGRLLPQMFAERGIVPIGYAVFAFAVGLVAGILIRRTVPAMAVTLVAFLGARMAVQFGLREHLVAAKQASLAITGGLGISRTPSGFSLLPPDVHIPGAWVFSERLVDSAGHGPSKAFVDSACGNLPGPPPGSSRSVSEAPPGVRDALGQCTAKVAARFHEVASYQPASHYWALQGVETAIFLGAAAALIGAAFWWLRHRLT